MDDRIRPIGYVSSPIKTKQDAPKMESEGGVRAVIRLEPGMETALDGLKAGSGVVLLTWFHLSDRTKLRVHPRGNPDNPERGVFSTRSPDRPNPIGLHETTIITIDGRELTVEPLEALDGTPVLDIKPQLRSIPGK